MGMTVAEAKKRSHKRLLEGYINALPKKQKNFQSKYGSYDFGAYHTTDEANEMYNAAQELHDLSNTYKYYLNTYGGGDEATISSLDSAMKNYKGILDSKDSYLDLYSQYNNAEAFNADIERRERLKTMDINAEKAKLDKYKSSYIPWDKGTATNKSDKEKIKQLEKDILEAEKIQKLMGYEALANNFDFATVSANRDFNNASRDEIQKYKAEENHITQMISPSGYGSFDSEGNIVNVYTGEIMYTATPMSVAVMNGTTNDIYNSLISDKLGMYLNSLDDESYYQFNEDVTSGNGNAWSDVYIEGQNNLWQYINEDEKATYYYLKNTEGDDAAYQYLEYMTNTFADREADKIYAWSKEHKLLGSLLSMVTNIESGAESIASLATGNINRSANVTSALREGASSDMDGVGKFFYNTGMSGADSLLSTFMPGIMGETMLALSAAGSTQNDILSRGGTQSQAVAGGIAAGIAEAFFEHVSLELLRDMDTKAIARSFSAFAKELAIEAGTNASEEAFTEIANIISDEIIMGSLSNISTMYDDAVRRGMTDSKARLYIAGQIGSQVAESAASGALMGLGFTALGGTYGTVKDEIDVYESGKNILNSPDAESIIEEYKYAANEFKDVDSVAKAAGKYNKKATASNLGRLEEEIRAESTKRSGMSWEQQKKEISKAAAEEKKALAERASADVQKTVSEAHSEAQRLKLSSDGRSGVTLGKMPAIVDYSGASSDNITIKDADGNAVKLSEAELADDDVGVAYILASQLGSVDAANAFIKAYNAESEQGYISPDSFYVDWLSIQSHGQISTWDGAMEKAFSAVGDRISEASKGAAFLAGRGLRESVSQKYEAEQAKYDKAWKEAGGKTVNATFKDTALRGKTLSQDQQDYRSFLRAYSRAMGTNVEVFYSEKGARKENGSYNRGTNTLRIDINAGIGNKATYDAVQNNVIGTLSHETVHNMRVTAPKQYEALSDFVTTELEKNTDYDLEKNVEDEIARYAAKGQKISREDAIEEIVARACEDRLGSSEALRDFLADLYAHDKDAANGFVKAVKEFLARLKEFFEKIAKMKSTAPEAQKFAEMGGDIVSELQKLFDDGVLAMREGNMARNAYNSSDLVEIDANTESVAPTMLSERTWTESEYVIHRDSKGNELSKEQIEFFKDSKVRNKKGNLIVLYHGTTANFNTFKKGDVGFHFGTKGAARGRVGFDKNVIIKEVYLNITNPIVFDEDLGSWDADYRLTRELYDRGILTQAEAESVLFTDDRRYRRSTETANKKLASVLLEKGYDGIAYSNTFETKNPTTSYIVFNSNQVKEITNKAPTSNSDIRYSDRDTDYLEAVTRGDMETAQRMVDEAAKEAGYQIKGYHQTGNEFTVFDIKRKGAGASDGETPYGVFIKPNSNDIGVNGNIQMSLYAKINKIFEATDRNDIVLKVKKLSPEYSDLHDKRKALDSEYKKLTEKAEKAEYDYIAEWRKNNPTASRIAIYEDARFNELQNVEETLIEEWVDKGSKIDVAMKEKLTEVLKGNGYDGVHLYKDQGSFGRYVETYIAFDNRQVKSADPITYDDNGNVIPLSERFNTEQPDIRYQDRRDANEKRISIGMTESERSRILKNAKITPPEISINEAFDVDFQELERNNWKAIKKPMLNKLRELGYLKSYRTDIVDVSFDFTGEGLRKSMNAQVSDYGGNLSDLAKVVMNIQPLLDNSVLLEIHADKAKGTSKENSRLLQTYVLLSAFREGETITPVQFEIKQYVDDNNRLYLAVALTKIETDVISDTALNGRERTRLLPVSDISIPQLIAKINPKDENFFKYIPNDLLSAEQIEAKKRALSKEAAKYGRQSSENLLQRRDNLPSSSEILADVFKSGKAYEKYAEHSQALKKYKDIQVRLKNSEKRIFEIDAEIKKLRSQRAQSGKGTRMDELYRMRKTAENKVESFRKQMFAMEAGDLYNVVISESRRLVEKQRKEDAEKYREKSKERTQNISKRGYIEMIEKRVKLLSKAITENSKDKHVPEIFKKTVGDFISAIDFSSKRALGGGAPTGKELSIAASMNAMSDTLANSSQNPELSTYLEACDLKGDVAEAFAKIAKKINDIALANGNNNALTLQQMTVEELKALSDSVRTITHLVSAANKLIGDNRYARVEDLFVQTIEDLKNFKAYSRDPKKVGYKLAKMFEWDNALPYYAFKRMGKAAFSLFEEFQDGFDDFAFKARDIVEYTEKLYNSKESRAWTDEIHEMKLDNDRTVYMSTADIMSLYCLSKRTQARNHIFQGGIRLNQTRTGHLVGEEKAKKKTYANNQQNVVIDEPTLLKILSKLTERQREVADGLQKFMVDECAKWGNEISMKRFGVAQFLDPTYFPITSSSLSLEKSENSTQEKTIYALLNASFTQKLNPHANNTVEVSDIFDVFATHAIEMAKYHAFAIPLIDMRKWENFRIKTGTNLGAQGTGFETKGVREMLKNAFGAEAERYITTFLKDINSLQDRERGADLLQSLASKYKVQAVAANINVALIQPISYIRVSAVMNPKYMLEEVKDTFKIREAIKKAEKHSGMMVWKSLGYRDVNIAASLSDKIKHTESMVEKLTENVTLKGAELADKLTWGAIWIACENEISDTQKGLAKGSPEYDKAVSRRFREVIYATQVVDSPLTKTQFMRGKTFWNSLTGSFMSEPSLSYNLFLDVATDIMDDKRNGKKLTSKHIKRLARAEGVLLIGAFSEALIRSFLDALHDYDEEDEEYFDLYFSNFLETFLSSAFAPKTPILNAIYKAFAGAIKGAFTSSSGMDVVAFQKLGRLGRNIVRLFQGKDVSWTTFVKSVFDAFSSFSGIPISNVWREAKSIWNGIVGSQNPSALIK